MKMITLEELDKYLPQADIIVCALPHTPETVHLLDEQFVAARNEFHTWNIVIACITWKSQPSGVSTVG